MKAEKIGLKPLLVTTEKGVFVGYGVPSDANNLRLENARMVVYWSQDTHGVLGLASAPPKHGTKIGPRVPAITIRNVTLCVEATSEAAQGWEQEPWN